MVRIKFGEIKEHWTSYIAKHPFQWWRTLTSKSTDNQNIVRKKIIEWVRKLCIDEHLQVGFIAVENEFNHRGHWHLLMLGKNRIGETLAGVSMKKWAKEWCAENCGKWIHWDNGARIRPVNEIMGVSSYLARNLIVEDPDFSDVFIYNKKLLKKCRLKSFQPNLINSANIRR